jgi:hypothetical protein
VGIWSIGSIRGRFQPEDFTETQGMEVKDLKSWGTVSRAMFSGWNPREVTISFVVDSVHTMESDENVMINGGTGLPMSDCPVNDPEKVWEYIQALQRPDSARKKVDPVLVQMPGWGSRNTELKYAFITSASIKRTHIRAGSESGGNTRAVRATITLTLKEAVFFSSAEEAEKKGQALVTEE